MSMSLHRLILILIALITVLSGLTQMLVPGTVLAIIGKGSTPLSAHLFATVGMFMLITGAMFLQTLLARSAERAVPFWIGVQKALAAVLVSIAVFRGFMIWPALGVAFFDAASAVLAFSFWRRMT